MLTREKMLNVRASEAELRMLRELSDHMGLSLSDTVRQLIRRAHSEEGLDRRRRQTKPKT